MVGTPSGSGVKSVRLIDRPGAAAHALSPLRLSIGQAVEKRIKTAVSSRLKLVEACSKNNGLYHAVSPA